jgi:hypothetical protein
MSYCPQPSHAEKFNRSLPAVLIAYHSTLQHRWDKGLPGSYTHLMWHRMKWRVRHCLRTPFHLGVILLPVDWRFKIFFQRSLLLVTASVDGIRRVRIWYKTGDVWRSDIIRTASHLLLKWMIWFGLGRIMWVVRERGFGEDSTSLEKVCLKLTPFLRPLRLGWFILSPDLMYRELISHI